MSFSPYGAAYDVFKDFCNDKMQIAKYAKIT